MSDIEKYGFTRTLTEIKAFTNLLSCSKCGSKFGSSSAFSTGKCKHSFCSACHENNASSICPILSCGVPTQPKDYEENRTLAQIAQSIQNIENLLVGVGSNDQEPVAVATSTGQPNDSSAGENVKKKVNSNRNTKKSCSPIVAGKAGPVNMNVEMVTNKEANSRKRSRTVTSEASRKTENLEKKNARGETTLHVACRKGETSVVTDLLNQGSDPNTRDNAGWTPLHEVSSHGRIEIAKLLLKAGANPGVPSDLERTTPLHDAVSCEDDVMAKLLVAYGADTQAKDKNGDTPLSLATTQAMRDVLKNTKVTVDLNESVRAKNSCSQKIVLCASKQVLGNPVSKKIFDAASKIGIKKTGSSFNSSVTHLVIGTDEHLSPKSFFYMAALVTGIDIVKISWIIESLKLSTIIEDTSPFIVEFDDADKAGSEKYKQLVESQQPKILTGLHFFLMPNVTKRDQYGNLLKLSGGKVVTREPDPEWIPQEEVSVPHHVSEQSTLSKTSHILIYEDNGVKEPLLKYNMEHVKTLPLSWLLCCIRKCELLDPNTLN